MNVIRSVPEIEQAREIFYNLSFSESVGKKWNRIIVITDAITWKTHTITKSGQALLFDQTVCKEVLILRHTDKQKEEFFLKGNSIWNNVPYYQIWEHGQATHIPNMNIARMGYVVVKSIPFSHFDTMTIPSCITSVQ